jgi:uncharacterized protein (TIGR02246 family)
MTEPQSEQVPVELQAIADRLAIVEVLHRYAFGIDDADFDALATVFTPDAVMELPGWGVRDGRPAIIELISGVVAELDATQHYVTNATVTSLDGDAATARCYLWAQHILHGTPGGDLFVVGGQYLDELVRLDGSWRIRRRHLQRTWTDGNPAVRQPR